MSRYDEILSEQGKDQQESFMDPRKDDLPDDSPLWILLFTLIRKHLPKDKTFLGLIIGFRGMGCRIRKVDGGSLKLRPTIDPTGRTGFESNDEYKKYCERWLKPYFDRLIDLLKLLRMEAEKQGLSIPS
jgi:hypothetical protein